ncbi:MAG: tetratricopeptide repeat protein [Candidatus Omnitrophota bacterium]
MNAFRKTSAVLLVCVLVGGWFVHPAAGQSFKEADQFYKDSKYDEAVEAYEKLLRGGSESGNLYYNLGNSYFKKGDLGRAILNYERAKLFIPHDSDLRSNYDFVRGVLNLPARYSSEIWFFRWLDRLFDGAGLNMLTILVSALWLTMIVLLSAALFLSAFRQFAAPLAGMLAVLLIVCSLALSRKIGYYEHGAVVTANGADAKFEPNSGATTYFKLAEGQSILMLDRSAGWVKILRPDSKIGWVEAADVSAIR